MTKENDVFTLPAAPKGLCFDKNYFIRSNFSVDSFLHEHRHVGSLETIRDDLGIYLKILRSAMIELINKDYADFVNLSATLIGLDKAILGIQTPLGQLREEVMHVKQCLEDAMKELAIRLEQRKALRLKKQSLHYYRQTQHALKKLSAILQVTESEKADLSLEIIERAAVEYNHLQFAIIKCQSLVTSEQNDIYVHLGNVLTRSLGNKLIFHYKTKQCEAILRCLNVFATLGKISDVEKIVRKEIVAVAMHNVISESSLQKDQHGLNGIYENVFDFLDSDLKPILKVTHNYGKLPPVRGYNILLNSFWSEVEERIEIHMSSIFAPGNPEVFYERYNISMEFIRKLEIYFGNKTDLIAFHNHPQFKAFRQRWNLPVYFQIRFQEIAGAFETLLINLNDATKIQDNFEFHLAATSACWKSIQLCWTDGIFLKALGHRFWKLTLQILSRFTVWSQEFSNKKSDYSQEVLNIAQFDVVEFYTLLYADIDTIREKRTSILKMAERQLTGIQNTDVLHKSIEEANIQLLNLLPNIKKRTVEELSSKCVIHLNQVKDIPRLYRKTNKEIPSFPCPYIGCLAKVPIEFQKKFSSVIDKSSMSTWLEEIFSEITDQYYTAIDSVLTSVQKTEESLRRLKQIRDRSSQQSAEKSMGMTDDDKIRMQLIVDVKSYYDVVVNIDIDKNNVKRLSDLMNLINAVSSDVNSRSK